MKTISAVVRRRPIGNDDIAFRFNTDIQSKVENAMIALGHSTRNYFLTTDIRKSVPFGNILMVKVKILDKDGFILRVEL